MTPSLELMTLSLELMTPSLELMTLSLKLMTLSLKLMTLFTGTNDAVTGTYNSVTGTNDAITGTTNDAVTETNDTAIEASSLYHAHIELVPGTCPNIKTVFSGYRDSDFKDKTIVRPSYLYYGAPILVRQHLYIEMVPWSTNITSGVHPFTVLSSEVKTSSHQLPKL